MAYRRKQGITRSATFQEERIFRNPGDPFSSHHSRSNSSSSASLAAQAIRATAAHQASHSNGYISTADQGGGGFWGVVARKGKEILEDGYMEAPRQFQEGLASNHGTGLGLRSPWQQQTTTIHEDQLKASRDVAMATAAKAKLLLRELKTVKADLAFAKQRCSQLEEENKMLREAQEKGDHPADDDMIRLQLETLLAEKARLAHENSVYARENLILREIVEYHQLTMQDVVYLDEGIEEVTEVSPTPAISRMLSVSPPQSPKSMHKSPSRNSLTKSPSRNSLTKSPSRNTLTKSPSRNSLTKDATSTKIL